MRTLTKVSRPDEPFNTGVRDGSAGVPMGGTLAELRPEAAYFAEAGGRRTGILIVVVFPLIVFLGLTIGAPRLFGQTQQPAPFGYIHAADQHSQTAPASGLPNGPVTADQILRGRQLVASSGCSDCHNRGVNNPNDPNWLAGYVPKAPGLPFQIGPFKTYPANLTPDATTGIGKHSDRQIFNALRYGLDPEETPNVAITSAVPGQGSFPAAPEYLAPPMPWPAFRHNSDEDLWAIVAYLKHGIKPVNNTVPASDGPPDHWASSYTPDRIGPYPFPAYPAANEAFRP
jgi:hypothetical protein